MMKRDGIVAALRWLRPESGDFACEGCGWEESCETCGCRIALDAADMLENDETYGGVLRDAIEKWKKAYGTLRKKHSALLKQNGELRDAAAQVTKLAGDAAVEREWIPVTERLPEPMTWVLCACRDGQMRILRYDNIMDDWDLMIRNTCYRREHVKYWMPLPEPPKTDDRLA